MALTDLLQHPDSVTDRFTSSVIRDLLVHARQSNVISLAGGLPSESALPVERVGVAMDKILSQRGTTALQYGLTAGEPELQEQLAAAAPYRREPDQIVVTAGSQQALDLVIRVMASKDRQANIAIVEDPGYLGALQAFRGHGFTLAPIPVDEDGLDVELLGIQLASGLRPRLCYINPSFQNPTGASLSPDRAATLVQLAERYNFVILADDPYVELHLDGERPKPLPQSDMVVYLGSTSKTLSPGLRVGWLDADPALTSVAARAKQPIDLQTSTLNQLLVAELMGDKLWWSRHTEALRTDYRARRAALTQAVQHHLPDSAIANQCGGFFLWVTVSEHTSHERPMSSLDMTELLPKAVENGVAYVPGDAFTVATKQPNTVRLSYSSGDPERFDEAVRRLERTLSTGESRGRQS